jgi:hypothetical protein
MAEQYTGRLKVIGCIRSNPQISEVGDWWKTIPWSPTSEIFISGMGLLQDALHHT